MNTATVSIKPRLVLNPDAEDIPDPAPDETALIRVEVEGVGSFRIRVELSPAGLNDAGAVPADFLWATAWRATDDPSSDTDAKAGVAPVFEDEGDEGDDEEDEDEDEEGVFVEDEGLDAGPSPDDEEEEDEDEDEGEGEGEGEDDTQTLVPPGVAGAPQELAWVFEPTRGLYVKHPNAPGCYCPVCGGGDVEDTTIRVGSPCPACAARAGAPLPSPYAGLRR